MTAAHNQKHVPNNSPINNSVRAQILATEHWSLLATRGMTWSEVMSRITIHLAITSAALVVLALFAQISGFGIPFQILAIGLTTVILILGTLTNVRVTNASVDDALMLQGMNRLRTAYVDIDPEIEKYFVTGFNDDQKGIMQSYLMGAKRSLPSHIFGSTNMYMHIVNALVAGTLGALITNTAGGDAIIMIVVGLFAGILCLFCWIVVDRKSFHAKNIQANFPTTDKINSPQSKS